MLIVRLSPLRTFGESAYRGPRVIRRGRSSMNLKSIGSGLCVLSLASLLGLSAASAVRQGYRAPRNYSR